MALGRFSGFLSRSMLVNFFTKGEVEGGSGFGSSSVIDLTNLNWLSILKGKEEETKR